MILIVETQLQLRIYGPRVKDANAIPIPTSATNNGTY